MLGIGILCVPQFAVLSFATIFMHDAARFGLTAISATMAALQLGAIAMRVWSGRHTDRHGNRRAYLRVSTIVACASFIALGVRDGFGRGPARSACGDADSRGRVRVSVARRRVHGTGDACGHRARRHRARHGEHGRLRRLFLDAARHPACARDRFLADGLARRGRVRVVRMAVVSEARGALKLAVHVISDAERIVILIGQYDSPFVRRVAIALKLYGMAYEHRPWSIFSDAGKIAPFNPLSACRRSCSIPATCLSKAR